MLWSYFFAKAEVEKSDLYAGYCRQMVQLLPLLRCYHTRQELGTTFFQWQCYFATHVIYYFSDYGQQALNRQLFSEEFRLFVSNLEYVTKDLKVRCHIIQIIFVIKCIYTLSYIYDGMKLLAFL